VTLSAAVLRAATDLQQAGLSADVARIDAGVLARHLLGWDTAEWLIRQGEAATDEFYLAFEAAVERRRLREPVAYITGVREFYGRPFRVTRDVLIPRPETELVVDEALKALADDQARDARRYLAADVGTGSGCLAITLALERADVDVVATDTSRAALDVARDNARRLNAVAQVTCREVSFLGDDRERFDLVVSNPPYVAEQDRLSLDTDVRDYEPAAALFAGADGLGVIRTLVPAAARGLAAGGWLVMEFGAGQSPAVRDMLRASPVLEETRVVPDLAGIPRVMVARKRSSSV